MAAVTAPYPCTNVALEKGAPCYLAALPTKHEETRCDIILRASNYVNITSV
jgi:hypothetical protein